MNSFSYLDLFNLYRTDGMYLYQDSFNWFASSSFHLMMILLGNYFCMNLVLAVIADTFGEALALEDEEEAQAPVVDTQVRPRKSFRQSLSTMSLEPTTIDAAGQDAPAAVEDTAAASIDPARQFCTNIIENPHFIQGIFACIIVNATTLSIEHARVECLPLVDVSVADPSTSEFYGYFKLQQPECIIQANTMTPAMIRFLYGSNFFFVLVFAIEAAMKLIALRPKVYFNDNFNCFDFFVVIISFIELGANAKGVVALRCLRLLRLFKAARSWSTLRAIIISLLNVLPSMTSLTIMLLLYMFIAAIAGMQLLGNVIPFSTRARYTDFGIAMLTVFQCLTGENWNNILIDAISDTGSYAYVFYFVLVLIIGQFLVLNLFLAILLSDFNCGEPSTFSLAVVAKLLFPRRAVLLLPTSLQKLLTSADPKKEDTATSGTEEEEPLQIFAETTPQLSMDDTPVDDPYFTEREMERMVAKKKEATVLKSKVNVLEETQRKLHDLSVQRHDKLVGDGFRGSVEVAEIEHQLRDKRHEKEEKKRHELTGVSLGLFGPDSEFRRSCAMISRHPNFERFILSCVVFSCIVLACDGPTTKHNNHDWRALAVIDFIFVIIFTVEAALKIVTLGFLEPPDAYAKDPWNILDFFIVIIAWVSADYFFFTSASSGTGDGLRTFRSMRCLRPLRTVKRMPGMRLVVGVLLECGPVFVNIVSVVLFFFFVFAVIGVQSFAGRYWSCNDASVDRVDQCWGCFFDSTSMNPSKHCPDGYSERKWMNSKMNFDNVLQALLTVYEVSSGELWLFVMYAGMDARQEYSINAHGQRKFPFGSQPQQEANAWAALYFVVFTVVGVFIMLNLFVGAVVDKFNQLKASNGGMSPLQTAEQAQYAESMAIMSRFRPFKVQVAPHRPRIFVGIESHVARLWWKFRMICYRVVMWDVSGKGLGTTFDSIISALVMTNIIIMGVAFWTRIPDGAAYAVNSIQIMKFENTNYAVNLSIANDVFTLIFLLEMIVKFCAWGFKQ